MDKLLEHNLLNGVRAILHGIEMLETEDKDGWWETSTGREFGVAKLEELIAFISDVVHSNT